MASIKALKPPNNTVVASKIWACENFKDLKSVQKTLGCLDLGLFTKPFI